MDYFQGVVTEFLRANRATFVNTECLLQLEPGDSPAKGRHWYCDVVAVNFETKTVDLCEVTYSKSLSALFDRLNSWATHWSGLRSAISRDCKLPNDWAIRPRVFIPAGREPTYSRKFLQLASLVGGTGQMPRPLVTHLETVLPWNYRSWDRKSDSFESSP